MARRRASCAGPPRRAPRLPARGRFVPPAGGENRRRASRAGCRPWWWSQDEAGRRHLGSRERVSDPHLGSVVVACDKIAARVAELGAEISRDYVGRRPVLVGVLKGAFMFMADLAR